MTQIKVIIEPCGLKAREKNPFGDKPKIEDAVDYGDSVMGGDELPPLGIRKFHKDLEKWQQAEDNRKVYKIANKRRHKWIDSYIGLFKKPPAECKECGLNKTYEGGPFKTWRYWRPAISYLKLPYETIHLPPCFKPGTEHNAEVIDENTVIIL